MTRRKRITSVLELLDVLEKLAQRKDDISLRNVMDEIGHRSFGPLLLFAGLIIAAPGIGDIPGVPTGVGVFILLVAGQMVLGRGQVWLPQWLLDRSVSDERLAKTVGWLRKPARYLDTIIKRRLVAFTNNAGALAISVTCSAIAILTPFMEVVLLAANIAGAAVSAFGLALVAHDGVLAIIAFMLTLLLGALGIYALLG
jgi:hypothetical protein